MSQRYEREIDEIIKRTGADLRTRTTLKQAFADLQRRTRHQAQRNFPSALRIITPTRVGSIGIILLLGRYALRLPFRWVAATRSAELFQTRRPPGRRRRAAGRSGYPRRRL